MTGLQRELDELERTNPAVAAASRRVDEVSQQIRERGHDRLAAERASSDDLTIDPVEAYHECNRRMKRIRACMERREVIEQTAKMQLGEIQAWRDQELGALDGEVERLRMEMQPIVKMLTLDEPRGKRSVNLIAGVVGFRAGRERVVVEDSDRAIDALRDLGPECIREVTTTAVDIPALKRRFPQPGVVPGIRVERGEDVFYTEPIGDPAR